DFVSRLCAGGGEHFFVDNEPVSLTFSAEKRGSKYDALQRAAYAPAAPVRPGFLGIEGQTRDDPGRRGADLFEEGAEGFGFGGRHRSGFSIAVCFTRINSPSCAVPIVVPFLCDGIEEDSRSHAPGTAQCPIRRPVQ